MVDMTDSQNSFVDNLLAADGESTTSDKYRIQLLKEVANREILFEKRLRIVALTAGVLTLACIVMFGAALLFIRIEDGLKQEIARMVLLISGLIGGLGLFVGVLAMVCWFFRSSKPSLVVIEGRLAALESLLDEPQKSR